MSAPAMLHIVGPQGAAKLLVCQWMAKVLGAAGQQVAVVEHADCHADNDAIRSVYRSADLIVTLADSPNERHSNGQLEADDLVIYLAKTPENYGTAAYRLLSKEPQQLGTGDIEALRRMGYEVTFAQEVTS